MAESNFDVQSLDGLYLSMKRQHHIMIESLSCEGVSHTTGC